MSETVTEVLRLPAVRDSGPDAGCLPPVQVGDDRYAPALQPGDRLLPVTCTRRKPRLGEFVLVDGGSGVQLVRFIEMRRARHPAPLLVWTGRDYARLPANALQARILSVVRAGRSWELVVRTGWAGRDWLMARFHRLLARVRRATRDRFATAANRQGDR